MRTALSLALIATLLHGGILVAQDPPPQADHQEHVRDAIRGALSLLEQASAGSAEQRLCFTCHSQALPVMALTEAKVRGFEIDEANLQRQLDHTAAHLKRGHKAYLAGKGQGGRVDTAGYALWTLEAGKREPTEVTGAVTEYVLTTDDDSGGWKNSSKRPPSEVSSFTTTYLALRGLAAFGSAEQAERIDERTKGAAKWLLEREPSTTEDRVFQLRSLSYTSADNETERRLADELISQQRDDGGWSQKSEMKSDAYATGTALVALARTGHLAPSSDGYQRGLHFLLSTQHDDGSWYVDSRSKPFQKYFETGFPHGEDQFISTTATAWSTIALLLALPESETSED
jgi:hypothetical protein